MATTNLTKNFQQQILQFGTNYKKKRLKFK